MSTPDGPPFFTKSGSFQDDLAALEAALWGPTANDPPPRASEARSPLLYGYVRARKNDLRTAERLRQLMTTWCTERGYVLGTAFKDLGANSKSTTRPGFGGLLGVLARLGTYGVVVPTLGHLSPDPDVCVQLQERIGRCGAHLLIMQPGIEPTTDLIGGT